MIENARVVPRGEIADIQYAAKTGDVHPLDREDAKRRLRQLEEWLENERQRSSDNRYQMALDEDFYDGLQWNDADAQVLLDRGQFPNVYNKIQPSVKWVTGTEKRTRIDFKVYGRSSDDRNEAENKTKLLKYLSDVNKSNYARSRAFEDAVKVGIGWLECGIRSDPSAELIFDRYESWRNVLHDSHSQHERDLRDARYIIRQRYTDLDIAMAMFPDRAHALRAAASYSDHVDGEDSDEWYLGQAMTRPVQSGGAMRMQTMDYASNTFNRRARVKFYEMQYRTPRRAKFLVGGGLSGVMFDPEDDRHSWMVQNESASVIERVAMLVHSAIFIRGTFCQDLLLPYRFNDFTLTPVWGNRRGRDGQPYGMIRMQRDPQESFNKRMSKALYVMSTRRILAEEGAVEDWDELRDEAARPDSVIKYKRGFALELHTDTEIAEEHLKYAQLDSVFIEQVAGVTDELMGRRTNAVSGKAIEARQDQGSTVTTDYFDNLRFATQVHGQKLLSLSEQYITFEKTVRVLGQRRGYDFTTLNQMGVNKETGQPELLNDITKTQADFIVSAQDFRESMRIAAFEQLLEMTMKLMQVDPKLGLTLLDDVLEFSDMPGVDIVIKAIRSITGERAADDPVSPQEQQAMDQQKAAENAKKQMLEELAIKDAQAEVGEKMAKIEKLLADAAKARAEVGADGGDERANAMQEQARKLVEQLKDKLQDVKMQAGLARMGNETKERVAELQAATSLAIADTNARAKLGAIDIQHAHAAEMADNEFTREVFVKHTDQAHQVGMAAMTLGTKVAGEEAGRQHKTQESARDREHQAKQVETQQKYQSAEGTKQRRHLSTEAERTREHSTTEAERDREIQQREAQAARGHETREGRESRNHDAKKQVRDLKVKASTAKLAAESKAKPKPKGTK
jgi:hypothetical protein